MDHLKKAISSIRTSLDSQLDSIQHELTVEIPKELQRTAAFGDLKENAEYHAAKERQDFLKARSQQLTVRLKSLMSVDVDTLPRDRVTLFSKVTLVDCDTDEETGYYIVFSEMIQQKNSGTSLKTNEFKEVSNTSPIARALMGNFLGEEVEIDKGGVKSEHEIIRIVNIEGKEVT